MELEKKMLHELIRDAKIITAALNTSISDAYFQFSDTKSLFRIIKYNFDIYGQTLQSDTLASLLRLSQRMLPDEQSRVSVLFEEIKLLPDCSDFNVLLDEFRAYYKTISIKNSLDRSVSFLHDKNPDKALEQIKSDIVSLERALNKEKFESRYFGSNYKEILFRYNDEKGHPEKYRGIELGFQELDTATNGLPKGSVTIIMGSQKSGKSVLLMNIAYHNFLKGKRIYYHVNEGGDELVQNRLACRGTGLVLDRILRRQLTDEEYQQYENFLTAVSTTNRLCIDPVPRSLSSTSYIERKVNALQIDGPVDLIIIDYMSIMKPEDTKSHKQTYEKLGDIALDLKELAEKLKIPILTIMHVNRQGILNDKKHFGLEDMGLSMEPAKHVDLMMSWRVNDEEELKTTRQTRGTLSIQASRFCGEADAELRVNTNVMRIEEFDLSKIL